MTEKSEELIYVPGKWDISYNYAAGKTVGHFLSQIRDHGKLWGIKCPKCERVLVPPRAFCERCFIPIDEWVELGNEGTVEAFTFVYEAFEGSPPPPYAIAYVRLDGASTALANFVDGVDLSDVDQAARDLNIGTRVQVVFDEKRQGRVTDFKYRVKAS